MTYTKQQWTDRVTDADADHMNHIEDGIAAAHAQLVPPPVNGKWLAAVGGVAVWQDLPASPGGAGGAIPGEIKMWSGSSLPTGFGNWVWADGFVYDAAVYPVASVNIAAGWRTHGGKPDPGPGFFRVPDLRGSTPVGMDAMPGGARANRVTRAAAATAAGTTGEEYHTTTQAEMPSHAHPLTDNGHAHSLYDPGHAHLLCMGSGDQPGPWMRLPCGNCSDGSVNGFPLSSDLGGPSSTNAWAEYAGTRMGVYGSGTGISIAGAGGGGAHENMPPTTFVPYIVKLDG